MRLPAPDLARHTLYMNDPRAGSWQPRYSRYSLRKRNTWTQKSLTCTPSNFATLFINVRQCTHWVIVTQDDILIPLSFRQNSTGISESTRKQVMFVSVLLDIPCTGSLQHRKEYAARCRTPRKNEKVMFAESGACDRSSAGSVSAKTDPQGTCRHQAKFQRSNKAYESTTPERIRSTPTPTTVKSILMPMHLVRCLQLLPFSRIVQPRAFLLPYLV